jgi:RNA polymerase sigma factor (sigma-70 family)
MDELADETLLTIVAAGRCFRTGPLRASAQAAAMILHERHNKPVEAYVRSRLSNPDEKEDAGEVVQTVWMKVWEKVGPDVECFRHWLMALTRNEVVSFLRRKGRNPVRVLSPAEEESAASGNPSPEALVLASERAEALRACLEEHPEEGRILTKRFLDGTRIEEVTGLEHSQSRVRLARAIKTIRRCIERRLR